MCFSAAPSSENDHGSMNLASKTAPVSLTSPSSVITAAQCRAARGLIAWSQQDLAQRSGIGTVAVHQLENGTSSPRRATLDVVRRAFEAAGVEFIDENGGGAGVRLRKAQD